MCLNLIQKQFNPPDPKVRRGWKYIIVAPFTGKFRSIYRNGVTYSTEWMTAETWATIKAQNDNSYSYSDRPKYQAGFHVFATREDARKARRILLQNTTGVTAKTPNIKLVKVEVKDVTAEGTDATTTSQEYFDAKIKTLVANQMRIVGVVKD